MAAFNVTFEGTAHYSRCVAIPFKEGDSTELAFARAAAEYPWPGITEENFPATDSEASSFVCPGNTISCFETIEEKVSPFQNLPANLLNGLWYLDMVATITGRMVSGLEADDADAARLEVAETAFNPWPELKGWSLMTNSPMTVLNVSNPVRSPKI